jgi:AAA+ ATPase superfamily predicted ATPase
LLSDPRPKVSRRDLYGFDEELGALSKYLKEPLTVVSGLRRTGKTSLVLTALNESDRPYVFIDLRGFRFLEGALLFDLEELQRVRREGL